MVSFQTNPISDSRFLALVRSAFGRFRAELAQGDHSFLLDRVWPWITQLSGTSHPEDYYLKLRSAPLLILPWWLEQSLVSLPDENFQADLIYATVNKYYFVRLVDDIMDGHGADLALLPMLSLWDSNFQAAYSRHFAPDHPFWEYFHRTLHLTALVTAQECTLTSIDLAAFLHFSVAKSCGATIALLAVCSRRDRLDVFPAWLRFWQAFARWNQMRDDLFDWHRDLKSGNLTYLLSEGARRKEPAESVESWFVREGFTWATQLLAEWTRNMKSAAGQLDCPPLEQYVELRAADLHRQTAAATKGVESLAALSGLEF